MKGQTRHHRRKRALMLLVSFTLATSCVVGATFAKYATNGAGGDQAVIAKFGVNIAANGQAFQKSYDSRGRSAVKTVLSEGNVIAPGTSGDMIAMKVSGKPEVSIDVTFEGQFAIANWEVVDKKEGKKYYCPLTITVGGVDINGWESESAEEFQNKVNQAIGAYSAQYDVKDFAGQPIDKLVRVPSVSWRWDFEGEHIIDEYDTYLANRACETPEEIETTGDNEKVAGVVLIIAVSIEQID